MLCLSGRGALFRARFARLSKVVVFYGTFACTSKGYVKRELLSLCSRERGHFTGLALFASQKGWFFGTFGCTSKGYVERGTSLALLEREGGTFRAHFACLSKVVFFLALLGAPVRGI